MPWNIVSNLWFHEVLQTKIIGQITKWNDEEKKKYIKKIQSKTVGFVYETLCVCKWCLVYVKILKQHDKPYYIYIYIYIHTYTQLIEIYILQFLD